VPDFMDHVLMGCSVVLSSRSLLVIGHHTSFHDFEIKLTLSGIG
jgi:hypothetical protein